MNERCCGEYNCRRTQPIRLYLGEFSGLVYAATRSKHMGGNTFSAVERHEVTEQMREFIRGNPAWVREVLAQESRPS
jgi:hypothetical protein